MKWLALKKQAFLINLRLMKKEIQIFLTALMFFTRIPCPQWIDHNPEILNKSSRYFSLIGILVGVLSGLTLWVTAIFVPKEIALILSVITSVLVTGAFHEDGFADVCDGFGGGWTKEKILSIMKDSRLGTYGLIGLLLLLGLKFFTLNHLTIHEITILLITGHAISRFMATLLIYTTPYVQDIDKSKIKPSAKSIHFKDVLICGLIAIIPMFLFNHNASFILILPLLVAVYQLRKYFMKWIGGHTGDCAGATQQITEVLFYLSYLALWKYIY